MRLKYIILVLIFIFSVSSAQQKNPPNIQDTSVVSASDSLTLTNKSAIDTSAQSEQSDIDAVVTATASDSLFFDVKNQQMQIFGNGNMKYKDTKLESGKIIVNFPTNELQAFGIPDTSDSTESGLIQTPSLTEGDETYTGTNIKYNFKNQRGFISLAENKTESQTYRGQKVKKVTKDVYFIEDGIYTTCQGEDPVTYFTASKMKVIYKDEVIARWIFMYIGGVPVPIPLPFAVFPAESGRRSGIIAPSYGKIGNRGWYFRNFGYFFAISDYMDLAITGDYYTRGGWGTRSRFRYAKRYDFSGNLNVGYSVITTGEKSDPARTEQVDWNLSLFHNQQFNPSTRLDVNLQFQSSSYLNNNSVSYNDLLRKDIISNATLSKRWDNGTSLTLNYNRRQNLESGDIYETLPSITYNVPILYPFRSKTSSTRSQSWYELIGVDYSGRLKNQRNKEEGTLNIRAGIQHNASIKASPKIGYFNFTPSVNYTEKWYNKKIEKVIVPEFVTDSLGNVVDTNYNVENRDIKEINFVRTFDVSLSAQTKLYGMFNINNFGVEALRHTVIPSISYRFRPDFSENKYGYYNEYVDQNGTLVRYDQYQQEVFGGVSSGQQQSINFSIGNIFEIKTIKDPTDTTSQQKKIQLLNLNLSSGYNFAADSLRLSDLRVSYRTQIGEWLNFSGSSSYTFYDYKDNTKINEFLADKGKGLFRLTNLNLSFSTNLSGEKISGENRQSSFGQQEQTDYAAFDRPDYIGLYDEVPSDFSIPWNLNLNYNFNLSKFNPNESTIRSTIGASLSVSLTQAWKLTFRGNYDFQEKEITAPQITIFRDLDCWEMNFTWNPLGTYSGFRFEIRMKAPELQDIKITKSRDIFSGR